jgi:AcrR family transcriptional regulator
MVVSKRDQNRIEQRQRILESARLLFASQSFDEVTVADIARDAKVARATVFNYFPSKRALIDSITDDVLAYYGGMLDRALADDTTPTPTLLRAIFEHMGEGIEGIQRFYKGVFREIAKLQVGLDEGEAASHTRELSVSRLAALMARGQERSDISPDHSSENLAYAFDSLAHGTIVNWLYTDPDKSLRDRMRRAVDILLGGVAIGPAAVRSDEPLPDVSHPAGL